MKFLITGVSGFVGEELSYFFQKEKNNSVLGIDKNEEFASDKIKFQKCDLVSDENIFNHVPDILIHLDIDKDITRKKFPGGNLLLTLTNLDHLFSGDNYLAKEVPIFGVPKLLFYT